MRRLLVPVALVVMAACGGGGGSAPPAGPSSNGLSAPTSFRVVLQKVNFTSNEVQVSWSGTGSAYHVFASSTPGGADKLSIDVTGTSYNWIAPREEAVYYMRVVATSGGNFSSPSTELPIFTIDLRNAIDALFFGAGPMADSPSLANFNPTAAVWPDGTVVQIRVSVEAGDAARSIAQTFSDDYAAVTGGAIRATVQVVADNMHAAQFADLPEFSIGMRVLQVCPQVGVIACANLGPAPIGPNRSFVNLNQPTGAVAVEHELGHSYGLNHVHVNSSSRPELNFLMNPVLLATGLSEPEKNAIIAARNGGMHPGMRRNEALAAGLVLPFTGQTSIHRQR